MSATAAKTDTDIRKLSKLIPRLASDYDGEVVATARAIERILSASGLTWHDLADRVSPEPTPGFDYDTANEYHRLANELIEREAWNTEKEHDFLLNVQAWTATGRRPSEKQRRWIECIAERV